MSKHVKSFYWVIKESFLVVKRAATPLLLSLFLALSLVIGLAQHHPLDLANGEDWETYSMSWKQATLSQVQAWLQQGGDVITEDQVSGSTAFDWAVAYSQNVDIITLLIQAGADVNNDNSQPDGISTPLSRAAHNPNPDITAALLRAGADVHLRDDGAVIEAGSNNNPEIIKLLLQAGANVNAADPIYGMTALMNAATYATPEVIRVLLEAE
jgi:ankyrin repeat protein